MGARQTGKTYLMESFGSSHFDSTIFIDFEKRPRAKSVFDGDLDPSVILPQLEALTGTRFIAGRTLVVLDEIRACPRAITALKYFYDSGLDIHVIGAGSLLGVAIRRDDFSFPVGKVRTVRLHPLDFEEFLIAMDETVLLEACRSAFFSSSPLPAAVHEELLSFYRTYLVTGGMPEVVSTFLDGRSFIAVQDVQAEILSKYKADIAKYDADSQKVLAQRAFETLPMQLAKENRKFQYNLIRKGATSALFGKSIEWLCSAGLALRCVKVTTPELPLNAYEDISSQMDSSVSLSMPHSFSVVRMCSTSLESDAPILGHAKKEKPDRSSVQRRSGRERKTGLGPATSTLARWSSTTELLSHCSILLTWNCPL